MVSVATMHEIRANWGWAGASLLCAAGIHACGDYSAPDTTDTATASNQPGAGGSAVSATVSGSSNMPPQPINSAGNGGSAGSEGAPAGELPITLGGVDAVATSDGCP